MITILIADDSKVIRSNMKKILNELGFSNIIEAYDGEDAVKKYIREKPTLTFLDVSMPKQNGLETLKAIKRVDAMAKIVMATTNGEEKVVMEAILHGAKSYVLKPLTCENVKSSITRTFPNMF